LIRGQSNATGGSDRNMVCVGQRCRAIAAANTCLRNG